MRKICTYTLFSLFSLLFFITVSYSCFWYFSSLKIKNLLAGIIIPYIDNEKFDIFHDFSGFPFYIIFRVTNPKFLSEQLTISSQVLVIKNKLFNKSLNIYIPSNLINITYGNEKKNIRCYTNDNNNFFIKLNDLPSSIRLNKNETIMSYLSTFRYEDYGLRCDVESNSENQQSVITEVNDKSNYIQINLKKELNGNIKLEFDFYTYRYKNTLNPKNYLNVDTKFDYEFVNYISASRINFNIERFLILGSNFTLTLDGGINNYNLVTSSFKDKINVNVSSYKELIMFMIGKKNHSKAFDALEKVIFSLSEKTTDNSIQFSIKYDDYIGSSFIGKLSAIDFINQLSQIIELNKQYSR